MGGYAIKKVVVPLLIPLVMIMLSSLSVFGADAKGKHVTEGSSLYSLKMPFIENAGQHPDKKIKYYAPTFEGAVAVADDGTITYFVQSGITIQEHLVAATTAPRGNVPSSATVNTFSGVDSKNWKNKLSTYDEISLGEVYQGVELNLKAYGKRVEKLFHVKPGGNPETIKMSVSGAKGLRISPDGGLEVLAGDEALRFSQPEAYQMVDGARKIVRVAYVVEGNCYGFVVGEYDRSRELVIDPIFTAKTIGGHGNETIKAIATDASGSVYIAGSTRSADIASPNSTYRGGLDAFVAKLDPTLETLVAFTYLGGIGDDEISAITVTAEGQIVVTGYTRSADFPTTTGAYENKHNGGSDAFVAQFDTTLQRLEASTLYGGGGEDKAIGIVVDPNGTVYIAGPTGSISLPAAALGYDSRHNGGIDAFIAAFDASLKHIRAVTYLGGSQNDLPTALAFAPDGTLLVAGTTSSADFPVTSDAYAKSKNGGSDVFVAKFDTRLRRLLASTFLGGSGNEEATALAVDGKGIIYLAGATWSMDFPAVLDAKANVSTGGSDAFVAKLSSSLAELTGSMLLGGSADDAAVALALDRDGLVYVAGNTRSAEFPVSPGANSPTLKGASDIFVAKLDDTLRKVIAATFVGGSANEEAHALLIDSQGMVCLGGTTTSADFAGVPDTNGYSDTFVVKIDSALAAQPAAPVTDENTTPTPTDPAAGTAPDSVAEPAGGTLAPSNGVAPSPSQGPALSVTPITTSASTPPYVAGPGWFNGSAPMVSPADAKIYHDAKQRELTASSLSGALQFKALSATDQNPEITELALALRKDPKLIYDYVHNYIDYLPYYGSLKGATLTYLDGSGNDFDQASLMIALLRASGYTAQYQLGTMTIPGDKLANWLGADQKWQAISSVISSGGVPMNSITADGTANFNRVWVKATIGGIDYLFDPAFKTYEYKNKIDIGAAMAYNQSDFLAAAGGTSGADYIQNVNEGNIRGKLATYATNLVNTIRNQYPNHDIKEIISGRNIVQSTLTQYPTTLPFTPSLSLSWDEIPASYTTTLRIQHAGINHPLNMSDLNGKRLTLTYSGADNHPELRLDGVVLASGTATTKGTKNDCVVTIDHPYPAKSIPTAPDGTYGDQAVTYKPISGASYAIVYNFGGVSDLIQQKRQRELDSYKAQGLADTSEPVLGETLNIMGITWLKEVAMMKRVLSSLAETVYIVHHSIGFMCQEDGYYIDVKASSGSTISKHTTDSSTYHPDEFALFKTDSLTLSALEHGILEQLMGADKPGVSTMKLFQLANAAGGKIYKINTFSELQSKFGYTTYAGKAGTHPCLTTVQAFNSWFGSPLAAGAATDKIYVCADSRFPSSGAIFQGYQPDDMVGLADEITQGKSLVLPDNGQLKLNSWQGKGYLSLKLGTTSMYMGMIIGGGYYGGYGSLKGNMYDSLPTYNPYVYTAPSPTYTTKISYDTFVNFNTASTALTTRCQAAPAASITSQASLTTSLSCSDPVDMASGAYYYDNSDLAVGGGETLGLEFARSYDSSFSYQKRALGYGWTHNYDIYLTPTSHAEPALGGRQPVDAASMIAAAYAMLDVLKSQDTLKGWLTASLVSKWAVDQTIDNAVTVHMGKKVAEYIRLADGTFAPPTGSTTQLIKNSDNTYSLLERFGTRTDFDSKSRIAKVTDVSGNPLTFTYTGDKLTTIQDAFGRTLTLGYNTDNLINLVTDTVNNRAVSYGYTNGELTSYKDPELKVWGYGYPTDKSHRMTTMTNPANLSTIPTVTNVYDAFGRVKNQIMPRQTQLDGSTTATLDFFFTGYSGAMRDPAGKVTTFYFDDKGRNSIEEDPLGNRTTKKYDGQNHVVLVTDPRLNQTGYQYNGQQNLTKTINALGKLNYETIFQYDPQLRLSDVIDPLTHTTHFEYDTKHHLTLTRNNEGNTTLATYNGLKGLKDTATDGRLTQTVITYDSYGNPQTSKTAAHPVITYGYDPIGRMTSLTDQVNSKTTFEYDKRGLLKKIIDPSRTYFTLLDYYDDGKLWKKTDRNNNTITYTYTPGRKLDTVTYPNAATVSFKYDKADDLREMRDPLGTTSYTYDPAGRLATQTDPHGFTVGYTYDAAGNLSELTYPGNKKVIYTYDELNRLKTVKIDWLAAKPVATYTWKDKEVDLLDNLVAFNGITTSYTFDTAHRLKGITIPSVASYQFTLLDGNGNRKEVTQSEPLLPTLGGGTTAYTPNATKNRLMTAGANGFTYDNEGQLKTGYGATYTFDYDHRLSGFGSNSYSYDGNGNRLKAIRSGVTTKYIYDAAGNLLAEADASNAITRYYVHGQGLLAAVTPTDQVYNYHYNAVGSTVAMTDQSQAMVNKYAYDAFGAVANQVEAIPQPFTYVGQFGVMREPNGFYYMRARYYDPSVGRFISEDPIGFAGGDVNVSAYVQNNPIRYVDPYGLCSKPGDNFAKDITFGFMAAGVVVWESAKMATIDATKATMSEVLKVPVVLDKAYTGYEAYQNITHEYREIGERVGGRINNLKQWWYGGTN